MVAGIPRKVHPAYEGVPPYFIFLGRAKVKDSLCGVFFPGVEVYSNRCRQIEVDKP